MLNLKKQLSIGVAAAGIGLTALSSFAQTPAADGRGTAGHHAPTPEQIAKFEQRRAKHEAQFHDKLKITAAQEGAWKTFIGKIAPPRPTTPMARPAKADWSKLSAPERMERRLDMMKKMEVRLTERVAATKDFYAVLSPEQQKVFDQAMRKMEKRRFGHGRFGHHHGEQGVAGK